MESLNFPLQLPETELEVRKRLHQFHVDLQSVRNGTMQYPPVFSQCEMVDYCEHCRNSERRDDLGFEITVEDVENVLRKNHKRFDAEEIFDKYISIEN